MDPLTSALASQYQGAPPELDKMRTIGLIAALTGNKQLAGAGDALMGNVQQQQQYAMQAPHMQAQTEELQGRVAAQQRQAAASSSPQAGMALRVLLKKYGMQAPEGTPNPTLQHMADIGEKAFAAEQAANAKRDAARINQGLTGPAAPPAAGGPPVAAPVPSPIGGKVLAAQLAKLGTDLDPNGGRAGEFGKNKARVNAAKRILALALDKAGNPIDLNPQQMPELSQSLSSLIAGGGVGTQAQIEHLTPSTMRGDIQRQLQWLTGNPRGSDQIAFVKNMVETARREQDTAQAGIRETQKARIGKYGPLLRSNRDDARSVLKSYGWDLDEQGNPIPFDAETPPPAGAVHGRWNPATGKVEAVK